VAVKPNDLQCVYEAYQGVVRTVNSYTVFLHCDNSGPGNRSQTATNLLVVIVVGVLVVVGFSVVVGCSVV